MTQSSRCPWCGDDPLYVAYHDQEWGVPCHDDQQLFELLNLEGAQAGLNWITILRKRDNYRSAFNQFDAKKISRYTQAKVETLMANPGIVRNRLKINAVISNAQAYLALQKETGSFSEYLWQFVGHQPQQHRYKHLADCPSSTPESEAMSKALKKRGFKFVGTTICYAFMQAAGMVNDHLVSCPQHAIVAKHK